MSRATAWRALLRSTCRVCSLSQENELLISCVLQVIKEPMDLSLIRERIMSGALMSLDDMSRDLFVMCNNAMVFNGKGDPYFDYSKVYLPTPCVRATKYPPPPPLVQLSLGLFLFDPCVLFLRLTLRAR